MFLNCCRTVRRSRLSLDSQLECCMVVSLSAAYLLRKLIAWKTHTGPLPAFSFPPNHIEYVSSDMLLTIVTIWDSIVIHCGKLNNRSDEARLRSSFNNKTRVYLEATWFMNTSTRISTVDCSSGPHVDKQWQLNRVWGLSLSMEIYQALVIAQSKR